MLTWPFRARIDPPLEQRVQHRLVSFRLTDILVPLRSLAHGDASGGLPGSARCWRSPQACWVTFAVTYLVVALGLSLSAAGSCSR